MNNQNPVGEITPPCSSAPENMASSPSKAQPQPLTDVAGVQAAPANENTSTVQPNGTTAVMGVVKPQPGQFAYDYTAYQLPKKEAQPFTVTRADGWLAVACLVLGYLFVRWVSLNGYGVTLFSFAFAAVVLVYAKTKAIKPQRESWYWLTIMLLTSISFALWPGNLLEIWRFLLLFGSAVYWCGCLFGILLKSKTSNFMLLDAINLLIPLPLRNFGCLHRSLAVLPKKREQKVKKKSVLLPILAGLAICVPLLAAVLPLLSAADSTGFGRIMPQIMKFFINLSFWSYIQNEMMDIIGRLIISLPVAFYLCGLLAGGAHKRYARNIDTDNFSKVMSQFAVVPLSTIMVVLGVVSVVYLLFILFQLPYFFSAFAGIKPQQYQVYSSYAREGFFELCRIAFINLGLLAAAGSFSRPEQRKNPVFKAAVLVLSALTLLVIATAFSKMGLYIAVQGFTPKRIMTCVFMIFLAGVVLGAMVLQFKYFSIVRFSALYGAALLCALCLCNLDGLVLQYNAARYRDGSLPIFDYMIVENSGPAGVPIAVEIYNEMDIDDEENRWVLINAIQFAQAPAKDTRRTFQDNFANAAARQYIVRCKVDDEGNIKKWIEQTD